MPASPSAVAIRFRWWCATARNSTRGLSRSLVRYCRRGLDDRGCAMLKALSGYRTALCLISAIALIEFSIFLYSTSSGYDASDRIIRFVVPSALVFGIWVQSKIARYVGAAWFAISAVFLFWNLITARRLDVPSLLLLIAGTMSLATSFIL